MLKPIFLARPYPGWDIAAPSTTPLLSATMRSESLPVWIRVKSRSGLSPFFLAMARTRKSVREPKLDTAIFFPFKSSTRLISGFTAPYPYSLAILSNFSRAQLCDSDRRGPRFFRPGRARASDLGVDEIRLTVLSGPARSGESLFELPGGFDLFS